MDKAGRIGKNVVVDQIEIDLALEQRFGQPVVRSRG